MPRRRIHPLALAAGAFLLYRVLGPKNADAASSALPGPQPLFAGVPYVFVVRMPPVGDAETAETQEAEARAFLASKAATLVVFEPARDAVGGTLVSFRVVPAGASTIQRGKPFYDLGTLESVARLDGRPFAQAPRA